MIKEVTNLTNIKLTESDEDGIWLYFEAEDLKAGISLKSLLRTFRGEIVDATLRRWAREQLDSKKYHLVEIPDDEYPWHAVWGDPIKGKRGVGFKKAELAKEFIEASNNGRKIKTPIPFHVEECCGCMDVYFSCTCQELIAVCNECGAKREFFTNIHGDIHDCTLPFKEEGSAVPGARPSPPADGGY